MPNVMAVNPSVPAKTISEFIAYARANPGKLSMASPGNGSAPHLTGELFKMLTGVDMVHIPYRGGAPAMSDLIAGQVQVLFIGPAASIEYIRAGSVRALAVTTAARSEALPDIPTVGDIVPGFEFERLVRHCRTQDYALRDCRQAQQGDQRGPCRSQDQGAACRLWRHGACGLACRLRQAHRRRNREVGQGNQVRGDQGELIQGY